MSRQPFDPTDVDPSGQEYGSDAIADLLRAQGFEYVVFNPGASFRGLEESIVNYNDNAPTVIESPNEGLSVAIAHGLAKATGEPSLCILHNVVGTLNGAMGIYNAFADRVPMVLLSGTGPLRKRERRTWIEWIHSANVQGNLVRDFVKWDAQPVDVEGAVDDLVRAYQIAETSPRGPTYVTLDVELQERALDEPLGLPDLERLAPPTPMAPDPDAIKRAARALVEADRPVVVTDQVGDDPDAVAALTDLAERLGAPVVDPARRRFNVPNTHPMYVSGGAFFEAFDPDLVLAVDVWDVDQATGDFSTPLSSVVDGEFDLVDIGTHELGASGTFPNTYAVHETDIPILADSSLAVPRLRDAVAEELAAADGVEERIEQRREEIAALHDDLRARWREEAAAVWDETPVTNARLAGEIWETIRDDEWVLVGDTYGGWTDRLWEIESFEQYIGASAGGAGVGYGIGAAIGAAFAQDGTGRVPVNIQADGDLMQYLGGLWVLGRHEVPLFTVMYNNRTMYNSTNHRMRLAEQRGRDASFERALIGTGLTDPTPDYAAIAEAMGVRGYGPVTDPDDLGATLAEAWAEARDGSPVLVDVICQPD